VQETRRDYSLRRLSDLSDRLEPVLPHLADQPLCVYATGSYGRLEAWKGSDADLFFLYDSAAPDARFPFTTFVRLAACLIDAIDDLGFPPFTGDGKYLDVSYVSQMEKVLGSPDDDSLNAFTARMLLLLESRPVHDPDLHRRLLDRVLSFYYRDFSDHADAFIPVFLTNDILRFWRTLTLNYEHNRLKLLELAGGELERKKADSAVKNYKLKVSRLLTCFSMITHLAAETPPVTQQRVLDLCLITPRDRLLELRDRGDAAARIVDGLNEVYETFLDTTQRDEDELLEAFLEPDRRKEALHQASEFGRLIYELVKKTVPDDRLRFLVV
jgi:hypothetical protein